MNILVTGGYGFIGSYVVERFVKEGHFVTIIDNLTTGDRKNVQVKHKSYVLDVEDEKCEEIFKYGKFDIVVHLAAQINVTKSIEEPVHDTRVNILGLTNSLNLAARYKVKKFVFASSAAVYGLNKNIPLLENASCNPLSPYGMNKLLGEFYCQKWNELYALDTIVLRFANVYGPRQGLIGEGGVVSIFLNKIKENQPLTVYGNGEQTRDFIYVEDVADAIYRAAQSNFQGVMNLSTNTETSVNTLIQILGEMKPIEGVSYRDARVGDIERSKLDNTKIKKQLDWIPLYNFEEGVTKTTQWFLNHISENKQNKKAKWRLPSIGNAKPYLENILCCGIAFMLTWIAAKNAMNLVDFYLIYIIMVGVVYGTRQSLISVILSSVMYMGDNLSHGREIISLLYDVDSISKLAAYLFVGMTVGYSMDRQLNQYNSIKLDLDALRDKHDFLLEVYDDTRKVKDELQLQITNSENSFGKVYMIIKSLETFDVDRIYLEAVHVVEKIMKVECVSIYRLSSSQSYMQLAARSNVTGFEPAGIVHLHEQRLFGETVQKQTLMINKDLDRMQPLMLAPIVVQGEVIAVVTLDKAPFESFTLSNQNLFKLVVDIITSSLARAYELNQVMEKTLDGRNHQYTPVVASR
jgi:UDP-glucuronate decarboxylase